MPALYWVNVTIHVLAALLWLGGMFFIAVIGAPVLRAVEPPQLRQQLFHTLGLRFRTIGWRAIAVLLVTGVGNLYFRGWLTEGLLASGPFWRSRLGVTLAAKLIAVAAMLVTSAAHDFIVGPAAGRERPGSERAVALRRRASVIARVNAVIGLAIVIVAVRLARGG